MEIYKLECNHDHAGAKFSQTFKTHLFKSEPSCGFCIVSAQIKKFLSIHGKFTPDFERFLVKITWKSLGPSSIKSGFNKTVLSHYKEF